MLKRSDYSSLTVFELITASLLLWFHFFFVGVNFRESAETEMFVDIGIHGFDTYKWLLLLFMP